jgi:DNA-binding NarL/FixJ family response regulator
MRVNADEGPISAQELVELRERLKLSPRQTEIVNHVLHGRAYKQIAGEMGISTATVRTHLSRLFRKFDVNDRVELILHLMAALRTHNENHKK